MAKQNPKNAIIVEVDASTTMGEAGKKAKKHWRILGKMMLYP